MEKSNGSKPYEEDEAPPALTEGEWDRLLERIDNECVRVVKPFINVLMVGMEQGDRLPSMPLALSHVVIELHKDKRYFTVLKDRHADVQGETYHMGMLPMFLRLLEKRYGKQTT